MTLTKQQQEFLINNREIFEKIIPLQKTKLEREQQKLKLDSRGKQITNDKEKREAERTRKKIKDMVTKMTLADIKKFEELIKADNVTL